jgi:hypothetical protein
VFAAHCLTAGIPFATREGYGPFPLPAGEVPLGVLYSHADFYVDKMKKDLKSIGMWDRHRCILGTGAMQAFMWLKQLMCYVECQFSCLVVEAHQSYVQAMPHVNPGVVVVVFILFSFYRGHAQISKEFPEVRGVPEISPPQGNDREARNTKALLGFSTDMPWNPYRVP